MELLPQKNHHQAPMTIDPIDTPTIDTDNELITDKEVLYRKVVKSLDQTAAREWELAKSIKVVFKSHLNN